MCCSGLGVKYRVFLLQSVMFPKKCLVECSSLSENSDSGLNLASGSQSRCAGTGGSNKWKSQPRLREVCPEEKHEGDVFTRYCWFPLWIFSLNLNILNLFIYLYTWIWFYNGVLQLMRNRTASSLSLGRCNVWLLDYHTVTLTGKQSYGRFLKMQKNLKSLTLLLWFLPFICFVARFLVL